MKKNKGITLIALVITIIVLLILAGVAISMLSGENGILRKAAEAKTKTEQAQKEEAIALADMEIESHFISKSSKYKCGYGYVTGVTVENYQVTDTIKNLNDALPNGYTISGDGITDDTILHTGVEIKKDGKIVAKVIVFGDVNCDSKIDDDDSRLIVNFVDNGEELNNEQMVAADVNHNNIINSSNSTIVAEISQLQSKLNETDDMEEYTRLQAEIEELNKKNENDASNVLAYVTGEFDLIQNVYVPNPEKMECITKNSAREKYIKTIPSEFYSSGYKIEKYSNSSYIIRGITRGKTTVGEMKSVLPENTIIKCGSTVLSDEEVINEDAVRKTYTVYTNDEIFGELSVSRFE